jgi:glycine/D-amino acid oxidase-like deaminating enzyme
MGWHDGAEYLVQRPDTTLVFGGGRRLAESHSPLSKLEKSIKGSDFIDAEIGNADDTAIDPQISQFLHTFLPNQLPLTQTLGNQPPVHSIREWSGIMGFSNDSHPYVGQVPGQKNKWVMGGFTGHGMPRIFLSAKALVQQILDVEEGHKGPWPRWFPKAYIVKEGREKSAFDISSSSKSHN